jgi:hypothetical protein
MHIQRAILIKTSGAGCWVYGGKWRFPLVSEENPLDQDDAFFSTAPTYGEQVKNGLATCKTSDGDPANENPEALAGASGANWKSIQTVLRPAYLDRLDAARNLQAAIDACDPAIAAIIMNQELDALRIGEPCLALFSAMDQATTWAEWATPAEHKAYCLACFNAMPPKSRASFLHYVQGRTAA